MWKLEEDRPIYKQIADRLEREILGGRYRVGEKFPSVRDLALEAQVNPNTMQRALVLLEEMGYLESHRGGGGRVVASYRTGERKNELVQQKAKEYVAEMRALGVSDEQLLLAVHKATENRG